MGFGRNRFKFASEQVGCKRSGGIRLLCWHGGSFQRPDRQRQCRDWVAGTASSGNKLEVNGGTTFLNNTGNTELTLNAASSNYVNFYDTGTGGIAIGENRKRRANAFLPRDVLECKHRQRRDWVDDTGGVIGFVAKNRRLGLAGGK